MDMCSGKHCVWCRVCLSNTERFACDSCRMQAVEQMMFDEIIKESY